MLFFRYKTWTSITFFLDSVLKNYNKDISKYICENINNKDKYLNEIESVDKIFEVSQLSDLETINLIRKNDIDIILI